MKIKFHSEKFCVYQLQLIIYILMALSTTVLMANEKDLYDFMWLDPDKKVYVLQNKIHKKEKSFYINAGPGIGLSSSFQDTNMLHANFGHYFNEEWAIEGLYTKYSNSDNETFENLKRLNGTAPFIRMPKSNYGLLAKWSPFYGKINTFNKIFYFDWSFGLGMGVINTKSNAKTVSTRTISTNTYDDEKYTSVIAKTGLSFHINKNFHLGLDLIMNNYKAPGPTINGVTPSSKIRNNIDTILTIGVSF